MIFLIRTVLFDLDGTLLPLDEELFVQKYFQLLGKKLAKLGFDSQTMLAAIWQGTKAMINNNGEVTNEVCFWKTFEKTTKVFKSEIELEFLHFYENEFDLVREASKKQELAPWLVEKLKERGINLILATNPIFPQVATLKRMSWAGLDPQKFSLITTYENSCFAKPNLRYYQQIIQDLNLNSKECLMVGNDVDEDMIANQVGIGTYLITDCLNNRQQVDINLFPNGDFSQFVSYLFKMGII